MLSSKADNSLDDSCNDNESRF